MQLSERMRQSRDQEMEFSSPQRDVFARTLAYYTALQRLGCPASADEASGEVVWINSECLTLRRGYPDAENRCEGRLCYGLTLNGTPHVK